jgi:hypothetical protein
MTTYAKAAAKEKELVAQELKKGFFGRGRKDDFAFDYIFSWNFQPKFNDLSNFSFSSVFKFDCNSKNNFGTKIKKKLKSFIGRGIPQKNSLC